MGKSITKLVTPKGKFSIANIKQKCWQCPMESIQHISTKDKILAIILLLSAAILVYVITSCTISLMNLEHKNKLERLKRIRERVMYVIPPKHDPIQRNM